ncbi:hypothetical protein [Hymenobacter bucti]|uniref:Antitoxin VbhA domain-containing protein n=1 Tax=Hymenobacter bucti TaxID=1844114 RepID=A0ABW4QZU3_9BACT
MKNEQVHRKIIAAALFPAIGYTNVPSAYEQFLTDHYIAGRLTIHQSVRLLEEYHCHNASSGRRQHY